MATDTSLLIEQRLPDNDDALITPVAVRDVAHALDNQVPNQRRGGPFYVTYLTHAAALAAGQAQAASLDQLEAGLLCLGAVARVAQHPDQAGQWLVLVYDTVGGVTIGENGEVIPVGLAVALDGNFQGSVPGKWVKLDSAEAATANVPTWAANVSYPLGYLVRYRQAGGQESFYYSLQAGQLPHPTYNQTDAHWKVVPGPVAQTLLYQYITLNEAGGIEGATVVAGRRYGVVGKWNGSATDQLVYLDGLENYFRQRGTLLADDGSQQEVTANVGAGTFEAATGGAYTAGPGVEVAGTVISAIPHVASSSVLHFDQPSALYAPLATGTFTTNLANVLPGAVVRIVLAPGCTAPTLGSPFHVTGAHAPGATNEYLFLVEPDGVTVQCFIYQL